MKHTSRGQGHEIRRAGLPSPGVSECGTSHPQRAPSQTESAGECDGIAHRVTSVAALDSDRAGHLSVSPPVDSGRSDPDSSSQEHCICATGVVSDLAVPTMPPRAIRRAASRGFSPPRLSVTVCTFSDAPGG